MCGIVGFFSNQGKNIEQKLLKEMTDSMTHRGPDDSGYYFDGGIAFGHRRLEIIDLESGQQPMSDHEGQIWITFNGEIYNYLELREELEKRGHQFQTNSDTEVIIYCYQEYGLDFLSKLNGMFALGLWDKREQKLVIARDRLGIKPLFWTQMGGTDFLFASEIKALLKHPQVAPRPNPPAISTYLSCFRIYQDEETLFKGIYMVPPGYFLTIDKSGDLHKRQYWKIPLVPDNDKKDLGEDYYLETTRDLLKKSVQRRMISDVPLGAYLSGGLDSSIIVSLMSEILQERGVGDKLKTFSVGYDDGTSEFEFSRLMVERYKTDHQEVVMGLSQYMEVLEDLIEYKDLPLAVANEVPLHVLSKQLKKDITVVLSGEGADELFAGYGMLNRAPFDYEMARFVTRCPNFFSQDQQDKMMAAIRRRYSYFFFDSEVDFFLVLYSWLNFADKNSILSNEFKSQLDEDKQFFNFWDQQFKEVKDLNHYDKYIYILEKIHLEGLLHRLDTSTMAASVEGRVPYCDHELVEFVFNMPVKYKMKWKSEDDRLAAWSHNSTEISQNLDYTKYILRKSFQDKLPQEIFQRNKFAFPVPLQRWFGPEQIGNIKNMLFKNPLTEYCFNPDNLRSWLDVQSHNNGELKIWMVVNLHLWLNKYFQ